MKKKNLLIIGSNYGKKVILIAAKKIKEIDKIYFFSKKLNRNSLNKFLIFYKIDFVFIAVPPKYQMNYIKDLIKLDKPFIAEKPLGVNYLNILKIEKKIKTLTYEPSIDLNFLSLNVFKLLKKKYIKNNTKNILLIWNVPGKNSKTWKSQSKYGGGLLFNFGIHCLSLLNFFFKELKIIKSEIHDEYLNINLIEKKQKIKIILIMKYNYKNRNKFILKIYNLSKNIICENNTNHYHSGYKIYKYNGLKNHKIKVFESKPKDNDRVEPVKLIMQNYLNYLKKIEKNKFSIKIGIKLHKLINEIQKKSVKI